MAAAAAPRTIVITVPAKSGLAFRKPTAVSIQGQVAAATTTTTQPASLQQQRLIRTAPISAARVVAPVAPTTIISVAAAAAAALGKRPASDLENTDPYVVIQPPRKRERLTHLTPEEKLNRRKLKNRVAAQTARDRKKLRTNTLEDSVHNLNAENQELLAENARLRQRLSQLSAENARLKRSAERVDSEDEKPPKIDNMAGVGSSVPTADPAPVGPSDGVSDIDLQRILDDLLSGTEFYHAAGVESDPLGADERDGAEDSSAVDADSDRDVDGSVEGVETQADGGVRMSFVPLDSLKLDMDDEPSTPDAFISGLGASQPTVAIVDRQITQLVPGSPYQNPISPVTPVGAYNHMPLLDVDLLDKALDKNADATYVDADPFLEAPVWEDTFTDLFGLVA